MSKRRSLIVLLLAMVMPLPLASRASAAPVYIGSIAVGDKPGGVAIDADADEIYVPSESTNALWIIDRTTHARLAMVGVGSAPHTVAVNPDTRRVYVSNHGSSTLSVIDAVSHLVVAAIPLARVWQFAVDRARNTIYAANEQGHVTVIDGQTNTISALDVGSGRTSQVAGVAFDAVRDRLYASQGGSIYALDGGTRQLVHGVLLAPNLDPGPLAVNTVTGRVYMVVYGGTDLWVVQEPEGFLYAVTYLRTNVDSAPVVDSETNRVYVPVGTSGIVVVNDTTVVASTGGSYVANQLVVDETRNRLYAAAKDYDAVAIFTEFIDTFIDSGPDGPTGETTPAFAFRGSRSGATFQCAMGQDAFAPCTSGQTFGPLSEGPHTLSVRAIDTDGEADPTPETRSFSVDLTPPDTNITGGPPDPTSSDAAGMAFAATDPGSSFECAIDGAPFASCVSPKGYAGLEDGMHTFAVRARDRAGNVDPTPAVRTFRVDTAAPVVAITSAPAAFEPSTNASFEFGAEAGSAFTCALDGGAASACSSPWTYTGLAEVHHQVRIRATDAAGNPSASPASHSWLADVTAPNVRINSGPAGVVNSPDASFGFDADEPVTFTCRLDDAAYATCLTGKSFVGLPEGTHTFAAMATDRAGNVSPLPAQRSWRASYAPPETTITAAPGRFVAVREATIGFTSEAGATFTCAIDDEPAGPCVSPVTYGSLSDGAHVVLVVATDPDGLADATPARVEWRVDTSPPILSIVAPARGDVMVNGEARNTPAPLVIVVGAPHVVVTAMDEGSGVEPPLVAIDDAEPVPMLPTDVPGRWEHRFTTVAPAGSHVLSVVATNGAGLRRQASVAFYSVPV